MAHDGTRGLQLALGSHWDAIVLDIRLPGLNGLDLCREVRAQMSHVPILMLTARGGELDRVLGLELGADDYLTKPFSVLELQARLKALLRRCAVTASRSLEAQAHKPSMIKQGSLRVDRVQRRSWQADVEVVLTPREFDLLWHFVQHPGRVFTRTELRPTSGATDTTATTTRSTATSIDFEASWATTVRSPVHPRRVGRWLSLRGHAVKAIAQTLRGPMCSNCMFARRLSPCRFCWSSAPRCSSCFAITAPRPHWRRGSA